MKRINEEEFNSIVESGEDAVFQFSANWCRPCKTLTPILEEACHEHDVNVYKIDIGENNELSVSKKVSSIPSVHLYSDNKLLDRFEGSKSKEFITESLTVAFGELFYD
tara:strand:+ start:6656 stop:6979 length:324 start_codon:yes stop_codon:yes gene_type:complete